MWDERDPALGCLVERTNSLGPYLVFALDLSDHQLGVGVYVKFAAADEDGVAKRGEKRGVFGEIVGCRAEVFGNPYNTREMDADSGFARISARAAIDVGLQLHELRDFEGMIEVFGVVEDALAGIARNDLIVPSNLLKDLRPDADLTNLAYLVPGRRDSDPAAMLANPVVPGDQIGRHRRLYFFALFYIGLERDEVAFILTFQGSALLMDLRLIFLQAGLSSFNVGLHRLRFHHEIQDVVFDFADGGLCILYFVLERAILFVRFYRHHLVAVFGNLALYRGDFRF